MKLNFEVKHHYFREIFNEIVQEINRVLKIKPKEVKIEKIKLVGTPEEIIKQFIGVVERFLNENKAILNVKTLKIKRLWMDSLFDKQEYSVTLQLLVGEIENKGKVKLVFNESKKENKDTIVNFDLEL